MLQQRDRRTRPRSAVDDDLHTAGGKTRKTVFNAHAVIVDIDRLGDEQRLGARHLQQIGLARLGQTRRDAGRQAGVVGDAEIEPVSR